MGIFIFAIFLFRSLSGVQSNVLLISSYDIMYNDKWFQKVVRIVIYVWEEAG